MKMIGVEDQTHKKIKILSANVEKTIYVLIEEAVVLLEQKYALVKEEEVKKK